MDSNTILNMVDIDKFYSKVQVLKSVNFNVREGEVHGLVGENGAGKSTLVKIIMGVTPSNAGKITFAGKELVIKNPRMAGEVGISTVFQELSIINELTVAENLFLSKEPQKAGVLINRKGMIEKTAELLKEYEIPISATELCENLSMANKQLIEILKAVSTKPRLLILDEPTSSLTKVETDLLFDIIGKLKNDGVGIIYISHRMDELFSITDRMTVLRDGYLIGTENTVDLNMDKIVTMMVGRDKDVSEVGGRTEKEFDEKVLEMIDIHGVDRFSGVSMELYKGEVLGITGLVGSGRSELMRILCGIDKKKSGDILIKGEKVNITSAKDAINCKIAMVPEERQKQGLVMIHDIEQNILTPNIKQFMKGPIVDKNRLTDFVKKQIDLLKIKTESTKKLCHELSGGNQQKVVIAKWLATKPEILIVDEPTSGIDIASKTEVHRIIRNLAENGVSVIFISSEMSELLSISDRVLVMNDSKIIAEHRSTNQEEIMEEILLDKMKNKEGVA